jgi:hypothetical protein
MIKTKPSHVFLAMQTLLAREEAYIAPIVDGDHRIEAAGVDDGQLFATTGDDRRANRFTLKGAFDRVLAEKANTLDTNTDPAARQLLDEAIHDVCGDRVYDGSEVLIRDNPSYHWTMKILARALGLASAKK